MFLIMRPFGIPKKGDAAAEEWGNGSSLIMFPKTRRGRYEEGCNRDYAWSRGEMGLNSG